MMGLILFLFLTNCGFMGIYDQSFECPPEEGLKCLSTSKVNEIMDA